MLRRLAGVTLVFILAGSGTAQALGLGDIRLQSALNEPFRAEIELLSVTPEELNNLTVELATPDTFERYGIDRPAFLSGFRFNVASRPGDRGVVVVTSTQPVTEPFVTFLAEATWPRGRLLREYTVLLDPPTFAGAPSEAPAPVRAPAPASQPERSDAGTIRRERPAAPSAPGRALGDGTSYRVQRADTLWEIAARVRPGPGLTMNQVMVALYEANPEAFDGNINLLRAGALLRIPSEDAMYRINRSQALAEVSRQNNAWRSDADRAGSLRLVPPDEAAETPAPTPGPTSTTATSRSSAELEQRVRRLESELAERERLLAIRDNELAALRRQLEEARAAAEAGEPVAEVDEAEPAVPGVDLEEDAAEPETEIFAEEAPAEPVAGEPAAEETVAEEPAAEEPAAAPEVETPSAVVARPAQPEPSWLDRVGGLLGSVWTYIGLGVVLVALLLAALARRRSSEGDETGTWEALDQDYEDEEEHEATQRLRALAEEDDSILVVEQEDKAGPAAATAAGAGAAALLDEEEESAEAWPDTSTSGAYALEDTFSSETAINLDQSDPLAEADFHMAYGLYDQAADLMRNAIEADPERNDLKAKLAEVYFVWGNKDAFVDAAENLHDALDGEKDAEWDKIVIMGQQIAPDHRLFAGTAKAGGAVDLSFDEEAGGGELDMDFGAEEESGLDMDFGTGEEPAATGAAPETTGADLDFVLDDDALDTEGTSEMLVDEDSLREAGADLEEDTRESPTIETSAYDDTQESPTLESAAVDDTQTQESPTVESPAAEDSTLETPTVESEAVDRDETSEMPAMTAEQEGLRADETAEIDLDDLDLDLGEMDESGERSATVLDLRSDEDLNEEDLAELDDDEATRLAPHTEDEEKTVLQPGSGKTETTLADDDATLLAPSEEDLAETAVSGEEIDVDLSGETGEMPALGGTDVDLDLDDLTAALKRSDLGDLEAPLDDDTVEQPAEETSELAGEVFDDDELDSIFDLEVDGELSDDDEVTGTVETEEISGEGRTQTEVGTKLDLARAYIDMGDPDGARSILEEVLEEGDQGQKQEATRLLETLTD